MFVYLYISVEGLKQQYTLLYVKKKCSFSCFRPNGTELVTGIQMRILLFCLLIPWDLKALLRGNFRGKELRQIGHNI